MPFDADQLETEPKLSIVVQVWHLLVSVSFRASSYVLRSSFLFKPKLKFFVEKRCNLNKSFDSELRVALRLSECLKKNCYPRKINVIKALDDVAQNHVEELVILQA